MQHSVITKRSRDACFALDDISACIASLAERIAALKDLEGKARNRRERLERDLEFLSQESNTTQKGNANG